MEDGERERHIEDDTNETWSNTSVETSDTVLGPDLAEAVSKAVVLSSVNALHLGLDDIDGVVGHGRAETCEGTGCEIHNDLVGNVLLNLFLGVLEDNEAHTLVGGLLQEGGHHALVDSTGTVGLHD